MLLFWLWHAERSRVTTHVRATGNVRFFPLLRVAAGSSLVLRPIGVQPLIPTLGSGISFGLVIVTVG